MPTTRQRLLQHLKKSPGQLISGQQISNQLGISRTAVWKHINRLKQDGHAIDAAPRKGYRLTRAADLLDAEEIQSGLATRIMGQPGVTVLAETDSTNQQAKAMAAQGAPEGTLVVADTQTQGRGRRGRDWFSPPGRSIHASIILRPLMAPAQAPRITLMSAVAVARTLIESAGLAATIKWPNDILIDGRKIAGILTEISTEMDQIDYVVVGLGINVHTRQEELPAEIAPLATSIGIEGGANLTRTQLLCALLLQFEACYRQLVDHGSLPIMKQWRRMTDIIGQKVDVDILDTRYTGIVQTVDDDGVLILKDDQGAIRRILSGDVTRMRSQSRDQARP